MMHGVLPSVSWASAGGCSFRCTNRSGTGSWAAIVLNERLPLSVNPWVMSMSVQWAVPRALPAR